MMRAMAPAPGEPRSSGSDDTDLDPEDAFLEVGEDGFLVSEGRSWHLPTDLDAWVMCAAIVAVAVAAVQTLAALAAGTLAEWVPVVVSVPLPLPAGYLSLVLLGGVIVLAVRREADAVAGRARWVQGAACLAAGTGSCLAIAQLAGNIGIIVRAPDEDGFGVAPVGAAASVVTGIGGFADVIAAVLATALGVVLFRWSLARSEARGGTGELSARTPGGGPALASLLLGAAVAAGALVAFQAGVTSSPNDLLAPVPSPSPTSSYSLLPYTLPPGGIEVVPSGCVQEASGECVGGSTYISASPTATP